ncbi:MAG: hypothetical protein ACLU2L_05610 [Fenollaria timonensis]
MKKIIFLAVILSLLFTFGCKTNDTGAVKNEKTASGETTETTEKSDVKEITVGQTWVITSDDPLDGSTVGASQTTASAITFILFKLMVL